jgi:hypothetical protein
MERRTSQALHLDHVEAALNAAPRCPRVGAHQVLNPVEVVATAGRAPMSAVLRAAQPDPQMAAKPTGLLLTVEQVALLWFGEVGEGGSASSNCQKIRRLIPDTLPARRIGNRWYVNRAAAEAWANGTDPAAVMAHPSNRELRETYDSLSAATAGGRDLNRVSDGARRAQANASRLEN